MLIKKSGLLRCALLACLAWPAGASGAELLVVVAASNPLTALRADQVADIFLGQAVRFPDGAPAVALDLPIGSAPRDAFYQQVAGKSPALVKAWWTKMIFTGRGQPPRAAADSVAVRRLVAANPALIGYIERSALDDSVRIVLVLP